MISAVVVAVIQSRRRTFPIEQASRSIPYAFPALPDLPFPEPTQQRLAYSTVHSMNRCPIKEHQTPE